MEKKRLHPGLTVRLFREEKCFGPGIAALLHRVQQLHSLRSAAADMNMAYSKAWSIVRQSEEQLGKKLLHSTAGGRNGGGAELTDFAVQMLAAYDAYYQELDEWTWTLFEKHFGPLLGDLPDKTI